MYHQLKNRKSQQSSAKQKVTTSQRRSQRNSLKRNRLRRQIKSYHRNKLNTTKPQARKPRKQAVYKPKFIKSPPRESFTEEEQFYSVEEQLNPEEEEEFHSEEEEEPRHLTQYELNAFARPRTGFGPKYVRE